MHYRNVSVFLTTLLLCLLTSPAVGQSKRGKAGGDGFPGKFKDQTDVTSILEANFKRLDRNGDGYLNQDEMPDDLRANLSKWDRNQDNLISLDEYQRYYVATRLQAKAQEQDQQGLDAFGPAFIAAYERAKELKHALQHKTTDTKRTEKAAEVLDSFLQAGKQFEVVVKQREEARALKRAKLEGGYTSNPDNFRKEIVNLRRDLDLALKEIKKLKDSLALGAPPPGEPNIPVAAQEQDKNSIQSLFEGLPADLRSKVIENRIRRDRVNDWLQENVNGKDKVIQMRAPMNVVATRAKDGSYIIKMQVEGVLVKTFGNTWYVLAHGVREGFQPVAISGRPNFPNFEFEGVSAADAEKLTDSKIATVQGKVKEITLEPQNPIADSPPPYCSLVLEDVRVNGKAFTPSKRPTLPQGRGR